MSCLSFLSLRGACGSRLQQHVEACCRLRTNMTGCTLAILHLEEALIVRILFLHGIQFVNPKECKFLDFCWYGCCRRSILDFPVPLPHLLVAKSRLVKSWNFRGAALSASKVKLQWPFFTSRLRCPSTVQLYPVSQAPPPSKKAPRVRSSQPPPWPRYPWDQR